MAVPTLAKNLSITYFSRISIQPRLRPSFLKTLELLLYLLQQQKLKDGLLGLKAFPLLSCSLSGRLRYLLKYTNYPSLERQGVSKRHPTIHLKVLAGAIMKQNVLLTTMQLRYSSRRWKLCTPIALAADQGLPSTQDL